MSKVPMPFVFLVHGAELHCSADWRKILKGISNRTQPGASGGGQRIRSVVAVMGAKIYIRFLKTCFDITIVLTIRWVRTSWVPSPTQKSIGRKASILVWLEGGVTEWNSFVQMGFPIFSFCPDTFNNATSKNKCALTKFSSYFQMGFPIFTYGPVAGLKSIHRAYARDSKLKSDSPTDLFSYYLPFN